jgi:phosphatidylserine/phosphatidylglycerophosphate/cardiolipin synthase-like enzyme
VGREPLSSRGIQLLADPLVEERLEEIRQQAAKRIRLKGEGQTLEQEAGTAVQLRDEEIRPAFLNALKGASEQIIIYSPWMNEQVIDGEFLSFLEERVRRGVRILIGYGIGRNERREERPVSPALLQRLRAIQTAEGTPGIIAEWLGNSHAKEIVIDRKVHFSGSQNWLSYRGDRLPRGETVYQVTIATEVEKAYKHLAQRFIERAKTLWARATDEERRVALCILGYLGYEQEALAWIQRGSCYHLIPLWLTLAQQAISTGQETRLFASLQTLITLRKSAIELSDPLLIEIDTALQAVLGGIARKNGELKRFSENESTVMESLFSSLKGE